MYHHEGKRSMTPLLEIKNIDKRFGVVHALKDVSLDVMKGETMALVGENGAGKSTLMKILTGAYTKDKGAIYVDGQKTNITNTVSVRKYGIAQIYQHAELVPELTVAENIFLGDPNFGMNGMIHWHKLFESAQTLLQKYNLPIDPTEKIKQLSVAKRQLVAIAKVLQCSPQVLIMDEPTAVLSDKEVDILFHLIELLKKEQMTIIYISHRLEEVFTVADRIAIMRDGALVAIMKNEFLTKADVIINMLGRKVESMYPEKTHNKSDEVILEAKSITTGHVHNISFQLHNGEILGIAGLVGSGRTELARAIYGLDKITTGSLHVKGKEIQVRGPASLLKRGVFLAPEDRKGEGLVQFRSIRENITLASLGRISKFAWCNGALERMLANQLRQSLNIKAPTVDTLVKNLSGGNQQKVVIAKAITAEPSILIVDEPTQGIDVGAKAEIYILLDDLRKQGMSIIFISSELGELQGMCDRLLIMRNGRIVGEVQDDLRDNKKILSLMYRSEDSDE